MPSPGHALPGDGTPAVRISGEAPRRRQPSQSAARRKAKKRPHRPRIAHQSDIITRSMLTHLIGIETTVVARWLRAGVIRARSDGRLPLEAVREAVRHIRRTQGTG